MYSNSVPRCTSTVYYLQYQYVYRMCIVCVRNLVCAYCTAVCVCMCTRVPQIYVYIVYPWLQLNSQANFPRMGSSGLKQHGRNDTDSHIKIQQVLLLRDFHVIIRCCHNSTPIVKRYCCWATAVNGGYCQQQQLRSPRK